MFKKYKNREHWFSEHKKFKSFPLWYQLSTFHHLSFDHNKENAHSDLVSWQKNYHTMMNSENGRQLFSQFLRENLADELILFWHAVEVSKRETDMVKLRDLGYELYSAFVMPESPLCINVDQKIAAVIANKLKLEYLDLEDIFDTTQKFVEKIMKSVYYPEFLKSDLYLKLVHHYEVNK